MIKIGIIGAMELEIAQLKEQMMIQTTVTQASMIFYEGVLEGKNIVLVRSGIGKVNAALCVQILVNIFQVSHIVNTGIAGSLNNDLNIGDIVISKDVVYHDVDATVFGYPLGEVPQLGRLAFEADKTLISLAINSCQHVNSDIHVMSGRVVSGDQFISSKEKKEFLIHQFHADCTEMEGAAIAHGAFLNQIPFVIIRAISDKADDSAEEDYPTFEKKAAAHSAHLLKYMLHHFSDVTL